MSVEIKGKGDGTTTRKKTFKKLKVKKKSESKRKLGKKIKDKKTAKFWTKGERKAENK